MSDNQFWKDNGYFVPFTHPVDFPDTEITDEPQMRLCFNADWLPFILGALKILARPETWEADAETVAVLTTEAMHIPALVQDNCEPAALTPFMRPYVTALNAGAYDADVFEQFWHVDDPSEPDPEFKFLLLCTGDGIDAIDVEVAWHRIPELCDVSPFLSSFAIETANGAVKAFTLIYHNAFGAVTTVTDFTPSFLSDFEIRDFRFIGADENSAYELTIVDTGDIFADCA